MTENTIWRFDLQPGNSLAVLKSLEDALQTTKDRISQVANAGQNFDRLATYEAKASEAGKRLQTAQAQAALALKKATDAANDGKSSSEQVAVAQAKAAQAATKVESAQVAVASAMRKATQESNRLAAAMQANASKSNQLSRALEGAKSSLSGVASTINSGAKVAFAALGLAIVGVATAIASTVPKATKYEATLKQIYATNDITRETVDGLNRSLLKLAGQVGKGPQDLGDALYYIMGAGYDSAAAMDILEKSAKQAAVGMTETETVANAATAVLKVFPALSVAKAFDMMTASVATGKTEWASYGPVIGRVALFAEQAGHNFGEATSALSVLTNVLPSTEQAATSLGSLFQTSSRFEELTKRANDLGLSFNKNAYKAMSFVDRLRYLRDITHGNKEAMQKLLGQEEAMPAINALLINDAKDYASALDKITNSAGEADTAWQKSSEGLGLSWSKVTATVDSLSMRVGMALIPAMKFFVENIAPAIQKTIDWIENNKVLENTMSKISDIFQKVSNFASQHIAPAFDKAKKALGDFTGTGEASTPILAGLGAVLITVLVPAVWSLAAGVIAATWPFIAIGLAVAGLTAIFLHFYNSNVGFRDFINNLGASLQQIGQNIMTNFMPAMQQVGNFIQTNVMPVLQQIGQFLSTTFKPVWDQLAATWRDQIQPALNDLWVAIQPLMPVFQAIGAIILGIVVVAFGILVSIIRGAVTAAAPMIAGFIQVFGGIVQGITGVVQVVIGIVQFFVHLFTGQWDKLGADLAAIWDGIVNMVMGFVNIFLGLWNGMIGGIIGMVSGFISGIIDFFTHLWDKLVGHSIIPDMVNGIIDWISQLPGRAFAFISDLVSGAIKFFSDLGSQAMTKASELVSGVVDWFSKLPGRASEAIGSLKDTIGKVIQGVIDSAMTWGSNIVNNIVEGIKGAIGKVGQVMSEIGATISSYLPHSPAKVGPLRELVNQGQIISEQIGEGMLAGMPDVVGAVRGVTMPIMTNLAMSAPQMPALAMPPSPYDGQVVSLLSQILYALEKQKTGGGIALNASVQADSLNAQRINQVVQSLSGREYEAILRGAY